MNLELVTTNALLAELFSRFDHAVFAGMKCGQQDEQGESVQHEHIERSGNSRTCQGLACAIIDKIDRQRETQVVRDDHDDGDGLLNQLPDND